jgi:hypothetical protein
MNWDFFSKRVCLTTYEDEWRKGKIHFDGVGLTVERFNSLPDIGPHQSFSKSEREVLLAFWQSEAPTLLHVEDDCEFRNLDHLEQALSELPEDWDIVYLGANLICWNNGEPWPERHSEHLFRIRAAWTTHAIGYSRKCVETIIAKQPGFSEQMFDQYLSGRLPEFKAYCVAPMVAYQRARYSSIWNKFDDYTPIFQESEERMR